MTQTVSEPAWLAGQRAAARDRYAALPVPTNREEAWRFTNLRGFDPDAFEVADAGLQLTEAELPDGVVFGAACSCVVSKSACSEPVRKYAPVTFAVAPGAAR